MGLDRPTRSFLKSTAVERSIGFVAASLFSTVYYLAPIYIIAAVYVATRLDGFAAMFCAPLLLSVLTPAWVLPKVGGWLFTSYAFQQIPKYFAYEEYHETTDADIAKMHAQGTRLVVCAHPHGIFPFTAVCAVVSTLGDAGGLGDEMRNLPTAAASVIRLVPILKDILGMFGIVDASGKVLAKRLAKRNGSIVLYVGGMIEMFRSSPTAETVFLRERKGFIKMALRVGADVMPVYMFGNTTVLQCLTAGPLASLSRKIGVSITLFWGRWGLPVPKPVKLVYARGRPIGMPHIPEPTEADVAHWHGVYCLRLLELFDTYKKFNQDYAHRQLVIE